MRARAAGLAGLAGLAVVLASCGGGAADAHFSSVGGSISGAGGGGYAARADTFDAADASDAPQAAAEGAGEGSSGSVSQVALPSTAGRDLVVTGAMTVEVEDVPAAQARANAAVEGAGGFVADEQSSYGEEPRATVTYRVPSTGYAQSVRAIGELGDVEEQTRSTEDVTDAVVDLESRLRTARASVERLRGFLAEATDLGQVASLESELLRRETEVETLTGSLRSVEDRVALATLVVTYHEPPAEDEEPVVAAVVADDELPTFLDGLHTGWTALVRGGQVLGAFAGLALPFLPVGALVLVAMRLGRRFTGRSDAPAPSATAV